MRQGAWHCDWVTSGLAKRDTSSKDARRDTTLRRAADTTLQEIRVTHTTSKGRDSVDVYVVKAVPCPEHSKLEGEIGFGYSQLRGVRGDSLGLQGSIEELPSVSFYATVNPDSWFQPYGGVRGGLVQLKGMRAMGTSGPVTGSGSTFEYGGIAGLALGIPRKWAAFIEIAWTFREFEGVNWMNGTQAATVSPALQAPLRLSTRTIAFGGQIQFTTSK